jgi:hypothetical protein
LIKDDCGLVSATPIVDDDVSSRPTYVSPSVIAAATFAALPTPESTPVQPWEMTASCLSLLAAAAAHYPSLVRVLLYSVLRALPVVLTAAICRC